MNVVTHDIAGIIFRTESSVRIPLIRKEPFNRFIVDKTKPDVIHHIYKLSPDSRKLPHLTLHEQEKLSCYANFSPNWIENTLLRFPQVRENLRDIPISSNGKGIGKEICVDEHHVLIRDFERKRFDVFYTDAFGGSAQDRPMLMPEYYIAANLAHIFSSYLPCFSSLLFHSSGVIRRDRAVLFLAPDEGGKTTVVEHADGMPVLSDDQIILQKKNGNFFAHSTPLGGITSGLCQARVGALFMLKKALEFRIEIIAPSTLVQFLWAEHSNYIFFLPKEIKKRAFELLSHICHHTPAYRMCFTKDRVDWDLIDAAIEKTDAC